MPKILTHEEMRKAQTVKRTLLTHEEMRREQQPWHPPTAEEEEIEEDWTLPVAATVGLATVPVSGAIAGIGAGVGTLGSEVISVGAGKLAGKIDPSLETPVYLATGLLSAFTAEKWLLDGLSKAPRQLPKFWSKEFALVNKKGLLSDQFIEDYADIIRGMDMGSTEAKEKMLNLFKQTAYQEKVERVGKHILKLKKEISPEISESIEKVIKKIKKKRFLEDADYQRIARLAKEDAVKDYTLKFDKIRNNILDKVVNEKWQAHEMKDCIETIIQKGGINSKYKFSSPELAKVFFKRHPELKAAKGVSPDLAKIADDFGYTNLDKMITDVYTTPNKSIFKQQAVTELAPEFKRIYNDEILAQIAEKESEYLFKLHGGTKGFTEGRILKQKHIEALQRVENTLPAKLVIQEVTSLKKSVSQLLKVIQKPIKDTKKLTRLREVFERRLTDYRAAVKVKTGLALINNRLKSYEGLQGEYVEQLQNLLSPLFPKTEMVRGVPQVIRTPLKKLDESMFIFLKRKYQDEFSIGADILLKKYDNLIKTFPLQSRDFLSLTYTQAKDLDDFVTMYKFVAKNDLYVTLKAEKMLLKVVAKEINRTAQTTIPKIKMFRARMTGTQLEELSKGSLGAVANSRRSAADLSSGALAALKRIEPICYQLDGFKKFGRSWHHIFNKMVMAEAAKEKLGRRIFGHYKKIFGAHTISVKSIEKNPSKYWSATSGNLVGYEIPKEAAFFMHMNSKNVANMKAMLKGLGVTPEVLTKFLSKALNKADLKLADDIFDFFDDTFPIVARTYKEKTGLTLQKVEGGRYYPIFSDLKYDTPIEKMEDFFIDTASTLYQAKVKDTFVQLRKGGVKAVRLDFQRLTQHLADMVHYTTHATPINEVQRLTRSADFKTAVETTMGKHIYAQFDPWLQNLAKPSVTKIDKIIGKIRRNVTFANLAFMPKTAARQCLSFVTAMPEIGYTNAITSLVEYVRNPLYFAKAIKEASPEMAMRKTTWNRDMADMMATFDIKSNKGAILRWGFAMIHHVDDITSSVVWLGAYKKGLKLHSGNGNKALNFAAGVVRGTQPASAAKDLPLILRSGEKWRSIAMFYSYWSVYFNQVGTTISKALSRHMTPTQTMGTLAWLAMAPVVTQHLAGLAWDSITGREREEEHLKAIAKGSIGNMVAGIPLAKEAVNSMLSGFDPRISPVTRVLDEIVTTGSIPFKTFDEDKEINKYDIESILKLTSYFTIVPSRAMITLTEGALRNYEKETEDWTELIDRPKFERK